LTGSGFATGLCCQFEIWTGKPAPAGDMLRAVTITLQDRAAQKLQKS
jgi:hypothetical protein